MSCSVICINKDTRRLSILSSGSDIRDGLVEFMVHTAFHMTSIANENEPLEGKFMYYRKNDSSNHEYVQLFKDSWIPYQSLEFAGTLFYLIEEKEA